MNRIKYIIISSIIVIFLINCKNILNNNHLITGKGMIVYQDLEGGFYGIIGDNDKNYLPVNLKSDFPEFRQDSLEVKFEGEKCEEQASVYMWGTLIELTEIKELELENES